MDRSWLYKSVYPTFLISKIFGLCTLKLDTRNGYELSIVGFLWSLTYLIFYIFCVINYTLHFDFYSKKQLMILHTVTSLNTITRVVTLIVLTLTALLSRKKIADILQQISEIDKCMIDLKINVDIKKSYTKFGNIIKCATICQIIHYFYYITLHYAYFQNGIGILSQDLSFVVSTTVATLNTAIVLHQFIILTLLLQRKFQWLNENFIGFAKKYKRYYLFKSQQQLAINHLNSLYLLHKKIRDATIATQNGFALTNLIVLLKSSVSLTTAIHLLLDDHFIHPDIKTKFIDDIKHLSSIFTNLFYITVLILTCSKTANEGNKMAALQMKLPLKSKLVVLKIWNFLLQAKQEQVNFTCYNLFTINESLFRTILGTVATFTVIIIQFGATFEK